MKKQRIAILGGGAGALTTAFELTNDPDWKDRYESITVYQLGWRLGGKGASGRNAEHSDRIQEHGLHVFMGFYDNAFQMMDAAYAECLRKNLTPDSPFPTVRDAFSPLSTIVLTEKAGGRWQLWPQQWAESAQFPGAGQPPAGDVKPFVVRLAELAADKIIESLPLPGPLRDMLMKTASLLAHRGLTNLIANILVRISTFCGRFFRHTLNMPRAAGLVHRIARGAMKGSTAGRAKDARTYEAQLSEVHARSRALRQKHRTGGTIEDNELADLVRDVDRIGRMLLRAVRALVGLLDADLRHNVIIADLALTVARGMLEDGLLDGDFEKVDDRDLSEWLRDHGSLFDAKDPLTRSLYDAAFAYLNGNPKTPRLGAGTGLYAALRLAFTFRGAIMWRMNAGMGDTIFTPLYQALKARGVTFEFFQKITNLGLAQDKKSVATVDIDVQAEVKPQRKDSFCPLVRVKTRINGSSKTLLCWPDRPNYDDLVQGDEMKSRRLINPDLESYWTDWSPTPAIKRRLVAGKDFDVLVLGIAVGALPFVCKELIAQDNTPSTTPNFKAMQKWRRMIDNVKTVRTQGFQLWLDRSAQEMGFEIPSRFSERPLLCSFVEPFDTWCDMTHLTPAENFQAPPAQIAYFCNAAPADPAQPAFTDHGYPERQKLQSLDRMNRFLDENAKTIWQNCMDKENPKQFNRRLIREHYLRLNVDPPEQYVLSVPGSRRSRLRPWESGYDNLFLAGDWTRSIMDLGCFEGAVISGKLAAAKIAGTAPDLLGMIGAKWEEV